MAVPPPPPAPGKLALRRWLRAARDAFVASGPPTIEPPARFLALLAPGTVVASYRPVGSEADPARLVEAALAQGCGLALPHVVDREGALRFLAWHPDHTLHPGPFGLEQPHRDRNEVRADIILAPLLGYDHALHRLGQGAGHYDRVFATLPDAVRIGIAWSVQHVDPLPSDPWDVPLHAVITEQGWIERTEP
jgi:5-formyltetrahydrofolate cyclo-ligase